MKNHETIENSILKNMRWNAHNTIDYMSYPGCLTIDKTINHCYMDINRQSKDKTMFPCFQLGTPPTVRSNWESRSALIRTTPVLGLRCFNVESLSLQEGHDRHQWVGHRACRIEKACYVWGIQNRSMLMCHRPPWTGKTVPSLRETVWNDINEAHLLQGTTG